MSLILQPFKSKRDITSEVAEHELSMQRKQKEEDKRLYKEYADERLSHERARMEHLHKGIQSVIDLADKSKWEEAVAQRENHRKGYDIFYKKLNKLQRENPVTLEQFTFIALNPEFIYQSAFPTPSNPKKGYMVFSPATARYGDMDLLSKDFEKEFY